MRLRTRYRLGAAVGAVLAVAGAVVAYAGYRAADDAAGAVRGYFAALVDGDAAAALGYGDVPPGPHALLTPAVLAEQQRLGPFRDVTVTGTALHGDSGTVGVSYTVAGRKRPVQDEVPVVRRDGTWRLVRSAIPTRLALDDAQDRATILGRRVPRGSVLLFPGVVPIRFDSPYLRIAAGSGYATFRTGEAVPLPVQLTAAGQQAMVGAVARALRSCLSGASVDPRCPIPDATYVPATFHGQLLDPVRRQLRADLQSGTAGLVTVTGSVRVAATYRRLTYANVAVAGQATLRLGIAASAFAIAPIRVDWAAQS